MKIEAIIMVAFLRRYNIKIFSESKEELNKWFKWIDDGLLDTIYYDYEEMWINVLNKSKILFDWESSDYNLYNEYLEKEFNLSSNEVENLDVEERNDLLYDKSDFIDKQNLCNKLLAKKITVFVDSFQE